MSLAAQLAHGLDALNLSAVSEVQQKLLDYVALIEKWNRVYNLTAVREPEKMLFHHVLDSLAVIPYVNGASTLDVGSGAGLPGIPLALVRPQASVTLLESSHKKSAFLKQAVIELGLVNVEVVTSRVETWNAPRKFDVVISRAFSDLADFVCLAGPLCESKGVLAAMKGVYPHEELLQLPPEYRIESVIPMAVPGLRAARHLVLIRAA